MKIIIFSILFTVQAQYIDDELISNENSSITNENDRTSFYDSIQMNISTMIPEIISSDGTSPINDLDLTTSSDQINIIIEELWFNINQSNRRDPYGSSLFWQRTDDRSWKGLSYILKSQPRCTRQMCSVKLKYNGTLSNRSSGCLSFSLQTRGQPVGQIWIVEDQEHENISQKIQLINKTLRIEHSLRSRIRNLSIETQILFRNPQIDALILSNLNVNWRGSCPKHRLVPTPSPHGIGRRATLDDGFLTISSEDPNLNTLTTDERFESSQESLIYDSTTIRSDQETNTKRSFSFLNQKNFGWFLSLITIFCFVILLSAIGHSLWLIRQYHHFTWHVAFDTQIQFLARRSIRSSTRSENQVATISQIAYDILNSDLQKDQTDISITNSDRSTPMSYYTYL